MRRSPEIPREPSQEDSQKQEKEKKLFELMDKAEKAETTPEKTKILREMKEVVGEKEEKEMKEFVSVKEAKEILGKKNVLGLEDVEKYILGGKVEEAWGKEGLEKIPEILYSKKDLEKAKELGEILVLRSPYGPGIYKEGEIFGPPTTIRCLRGNFPEYFLQRLRQESWFENEEFFYHDDIKDWEWKLVEKRPTLGGVTYKQQEEWIAKVKDGDFKDIERRRPVEIIYDTILYWRKNGTPPFIDKSDWSSKKLSPTEIVQISIKPILKQGPKGSKVEYKIAIGASHPGESMPELGTCLQR